MPPRGSQQRADDPEQRRAEQHGDQDDERLDRDGSLLDLRLDHVVLDLLVGDRVDHPHDQRDTGKLTNSVTIATSTAPSVPTSGIRSKKNTTASAAANATPRIVSRMNEASAIVACKSAPPT